MLHNTPYLFNRVDLDVGEWNEGVCLAAHQCYPYGQPCQRDVKVLSYSRLNSAWSLQKV